jgi:hypothetical protein
MRNKNVRTTLAARFSDRFVRRVQPGNLRFGAARSEPVAGAFALEPVDHTSAWGRLPNRRGFLRLAAPVLDCWLVRALLADKLDSSINKTTG